MNKKIRLLSAYLLCAAAFVFSSCADGSDIQGQFTSDVRNTQLQSPEIDKTCFSTVTMADGSENVKFTWPLVKGAGGYKVSVGLNTGNGVEPLITDSIVDGFNVIFPKYEDSKYDISVLALGNAELNNKEAQSATLYTYSTMISGVDVPAGDIATFINGYIAEHKAEIEASIADDPNNYELGFTLQEGGSYTMNDVVDFGLYPVTLQGADKVKRPTVTIGEAGYIMTQAGLKVKFINFDATNMPKKMGLITLGAVPDASISTEALGFKALGANQDGFVIMKPVVIQECWVKNLPATFLYGNGKNWSLTDFRIKNCIFQAANAGNTTPWINMTGASNGLIQKMTIENSTFYNSEKNEAEQYFIRYSNSSNAQPKKIFGDTNNFLEYTIKSSSFIRTNPKKDFANNMPNTQNGGKLWVSVTNCVFFDTFRLYQFLQSQWVKTTTGNFMSYSDLCSPQSTDYGPGGRTDNNGNFYTTLDESAEYTDAQLKPLDLTKPNGGVNLTPSGLSAAAKSGDPRWY